MEGIVRLDKSEYFERSKAIVRETLKEEVSEELLDILTDEIMDTCNSIGGDFGEDNIRSVTQQYIELKAIDRIKRNRGL